MRCPECQVNNADDAVACESCGLLLIKVRQELEARKPKRRAEDFAQSKRRAADKSTALCEFCAGDVPVNALKCQHCGEILNEEFHRERARKRRARINYASWVAYIFGLGALMIFRPVGLVSIAAGLLLSIAYYAVPADPVALRKNKDNSLFKFLTAQTKFERVSVAMPAFPKRRLVFVGTPLVAALIGYAANYFLLQQPMNDVLHGSNSFAGMNVSAHYEYWVVPGVVVYDLKSVGVNKTQLDVHTALLEYAKKLRLRKFDRVELSYKGATKFSIEGSDFQKVGTEYAKKNYDFVLYKLPQLLHPSAPDPDAKTPAEGRDSLLRFHQQWYGKDVFSQQALIH
jgi:predicted nucleic acid-binding Zn ribbon protein